MSGGVDPVLVMWGANMTRIADAKMSWPGFGYEPAETARFAELAKPVDEWTWQKFIWITAGLFILLAGLAIGLFFIPLLSWLYPDPSKTPASVFVCLLAATALASIGFGLPLAQRVAAPLALRGVDLSSLQPDPGDARLSAKVNFQVWRMTAIMCGIFIPGAMLWIAYDIQAGPIVTAIKAVAIVLMMGSMWFARRGAPGA